MYNTSTYLFLLIIKLFPLGTQQLAYLPKASIRVLCLDPLPPVLGEEHVCGQRTLGGIWVLFAFAAFGGTRFLSLAL